MIFYFIAHVSIGLLAANSSNLFLKSKLSPTDFPIWFGGNLFLLLNSFGIFCFVLAPFLTMFHWGIAWSLVTLAELILGALISGLIPLTYRIALTITGPFIIFLFSGALAKFWFLTDGIVILLLLIGFGVPLILTLSNGKQAGKTNFTEKNQSSLQQNLLSSATFFDKKAAPKNFASLQFLKRVEFNAIAKNSKKASLETIEQTQEILMMHFNLTVERNVYHILNFACYEANKYNGNAYDAAAKFILIRLWSLSSIASEKKIQFVDGHTRALEKLENKCRICSGHLLREINYIRESQKLSPL